MKMIKNILCKFFEGVSLAKFLGAMSTILILASVKFYISGSFHIDYSDFGNNIAIGLLGWTLNTGIINILREYLGIKGINFNLKQLMFGFDTHKMGIEVNSLDLEKPKHKLYNTMDSDSDVDMQDQSSTEKPVDKGKGIDRNIHPLYEGNENTDSGPSNNENKSLGKGNMIEPYLSTWNKVFPGLDPASVFFPKRTNPGPGFNVPNGLVPINDEICKHIDYNTHILNQFKKMDLETAIEQRDNYLTKVKILDSKLAYAQDALSKVPANSTTEHEFKLRSQILNDLEVMSKDKVRSEARATLLNSRIQFIQIKINNNN
jgi:hypothetical protein